MGRDPEWIKTEFTLKTKGKKSRVGHTTEFTTKTNEGNLERTQNSLQLNLVGKGGISNGHKTKFTTKSRGGGVSSGHKTEFTPKTNGENLE